MSLQNDIIKSDFYCNVRTEKVWIQNTSESNKNSLNPYKLIKWNMLIKIVIISNKGRVMKTCRVTTLDRDYVRGLVSTCRCTSAACRTSWYRSSCMRSSILFSSDVKRSLAVRLQDNNTTWHLSWGRHDKQHDICYEVIMTNNMTSVNNPFQTYSSQIVLGIVSFL